MFSNQLRYLRKSKKLNQVQLSQILGVKKQTISNWESNNIMPSVSMLERIADFFQVSTDYLLDRKELDSKIELMDITGLSDRERKMMVELVDILRRNKE